MKRVSFGLSDLGNRRRNNEDRFLRDDRRGIYVVCDGMGGAAAGEVASGNSAARVYGDMMAQGDILDALEKGDPDAAWQVTVALETSIRAANAHLWEEGRRVAERKGMGTTLSALVLAGNVAIIGHVGDSRIYHWHGGRARALTQDHTWVADQVRLGKMTPEEARVSKKQNLIMRALGIRADVQVDTRQVPVAAGDRFMLCSDGLHGYLDNDDEVTTLLGQHASLQRMALSAIAIARQRGGKDNITAVFVDCPAE